MKLITFFISSTLFSIQVLAVATPVEIDRKIEQLESVLRDRTPASYTYPTKFGALQFIREDGTLGEPAKAIKLNGVVLVSTIKQVNSQGGPVSLMTNLTSSSAFDSELKINGEGGKRNIRRMIVQVGEDGNCIKQFFILDFTGSKYYVTKQFGDNPADRYCLKFTKAKWGKSSSQITLDGSLNYIYYSAGDVIGPFAD